ncbi:isochorismatase family cysteine hydrolase [Streptomyces sp. NBC_01643]|uniref:cysteine hydrolase family protein n=1 Tax=Streptomyces sp. NBC_01643 TaxID=2975906 RepID=UPI002F915A51|nr:cysteine hydrolase [Streptomyces sp. NBC_01643]
MDTALIVIDMQNGFCSPDGSLPQYVLQMPNMGDVVDAISDLIATCRAARLPVIYTRLVWPDRNDCPARLLSNFPPHIHPLAPGTDSAIIDELAPRNEDTVIDKKTFNAFLGTDLDERLRRMGVKELVVAGVMTNVCVESTVRHASDLNYTVRVASDCTTGFPDLRDASLQVLQMIFAEQVAPWRECLEMVTSSGE